MQEIVQPIDIEAFQDRGYQAYKDFVEYSKLIQQIVYEMKEVPILPSEIPNRGDTHGLIKVEFPKEGGILTYMQNYVNPYRGFPYFAIVEKIDLIKKISRQLQSGFFHALKTKFYLLFLLIPVIPFARSIIWAFTYAGYRFLDRSKIKTVRYSKAVREIYRVFSKEQAGESEQIKDLRLMMRDIECSILEFDNAYRFRLQDVLPELNKEALKRNSIREMHRLLDILIEREKEEQYKDTWRLVKMFVSYYLRWDRPFLRLATGLFAELNTDEVKLTAEDKPYCIGRKDYTFGFAQEATEHGTRTQLEDYLLTQKQKGREEYLDKRFKILDESTAEHEKVMKETEVKLSEENQKPYAEAQNKLNAVYGEQGKQLNEEYNKKSSELLLSYLTQEEQEKIKQQRAKLIELDGIYDAKLQEVDDSYQLVEKN